MQPKSTSIWIDDSPKIVSSESFVIDLKLLRISEVSIMVETSEKSFDPIWNQKDLENVCRLYMDNNIATGITIWLEPSKSYIDEMVEWIKSIITCGIVAIEFDLEMLWKERFLNGFSLLSEAVSYTLHKLHYLCNEFDIRIDVTTHTGHLEASNVASMSPFVNRIYMQAYSIRNRLGDAIEWDGQYGPGNMQKLAIKCMNRIPGNAKHCYGLATWFQIWDHHTAEEAMLLAWNTLVDSDDIIEDVRFWSSKFICGSKANLYSSSFITFINETI